MLNSNPYWQQYRNLVRAFLKEASVLRTGFAAGGTRNFATLLQVPADVRATTPPAVIVFIEVYVCGDGGFRQTKVEAREPAVRAHIGTLAKLCAKQLAGPPMSKVSEVSLFVLNAPLAHSIQISAIVHFTYKTCSHCGPDFGLSAVFAFQWAQFDGHRCFFHPGC